MSAADALARHGREEPAALFPLTDEQLMFLTGPEQASSVSTPWVDAVGAEEGHEGLRG